MATLPDTGTRGLGASLVEQTVGQLRQSIFHGKFPPGAHLRELRLAKDLGVSQSTIREALQRLEASGLVTRTANIGTTVTRLSPREVRERVDLRVLLEVTAAQEASARMGEEEFRELERLLAVLCASVLLDDYYEAAQADLNFHRHVWRCAGNETLCGVLEQLTLPLMAFVSVLRATGVQHLVDVTESHQYLVDALRSKDAGLISEAFTYGARASYTDFMDNTPMSRRAQAFGMMAGRPGNGEPPAPNQ